MLTITENACILFSVDLYCSISHIFMNDCVGMIQNNQNGGWTMRLCVIIL